MDQQKESGCLPAAYVISHCIFYHCRDAMHCVSTMIKNVCRGGRSSRSLRSSRLIVNYQFFKIRKKGRLQRQQNKVKNEQYLIHAVIFK